MSTIRRAAFLALAAAAWMSASVAWGQIVINELVEDEQDFESNIDIKPDTRDFIELYNAGNSPVNIGGYQLNYYQLGTAPGVGNSYFATNDTIPANTFIPAHGYYVLGNDSVPNVNQPLGAAVDLYPQANAIFELWNGDRLSGTASIVDAVAVDTFRGTANQELANASQDQLNQIAAGQTVGANPTGGWWGQLESYDNGPDASYPNRPLSLGRYLDGRDTNRNGYDFAQIPATPGASNNLPLVPSLTIANVDSLATGTRLGTDYYGSFKLPRVITPGTVDTYNPNAISTPSPQGGKAVIAWDETGGGNAVFSTSYTNKFDLYAFIDPVAYNNTTANSTMNEATVYGIGTTDPLFGTPNVSGLMTGNPTGTTNQPGNIPSSSNGSTGIGWTFQKKTSNTAGTQATGAILQLVDFNDGGDSVQAPGFIDWQIKATVDLTGAAKGWHRLSVEYNPTTGAVTAMYDSTPYTFTTTTGLVGNFYVGYREGLPGTGATTANSRPPTYDMYVATGVPGDFNQNNKVDAADYVIWRKNTGNAALPNDNGLTTQAARYTLWRSAFSNPGAGAAVPEPGSLVLLALCGSAFVAGRRRWS